MISGDGVLYVDAVAVVNAIQSSLVSRENKVIEFLITKFSEETQRVLTLFGTSASKDTYSTITLHFWKTMLLSPNLAFAWNEGPL